MARNLDRVQRIVIVFMENRSFDHLLGYLSLPDNHPRWSEIEGVRGANDYYKGYKYPPRPLTSQSIDPDPEHERDDIDRQINSPGKPMTGFVDSYLAHHPNARPGAVMEYCTAQQVYVADFLARKFAVCDRWHACLPSSTLPNRLMAMSGCALVDSTPNSYFDEARNLFYGNPDDLVYDWIESRGRSWRVYTAGPSFFFMQMRRVLKLYQGDQQTHNLFRPIDTLIDDFKNGDTADVTFIEPCYQDDPRRGGLQATDDHAPAALSGGQRFLNLVWEAVSQPAVWENLLMTLSYDEHGSLFDHVMPPKFHLDPPPNALYSRAYETLGVRVPAIVISPFVEEGYVHHGVLDHTSILKFLGEKFGGGKYSKLVDPRPVGSISDVLSERLLDPAVPVRQPPQKD